VYESVGFVFGSVETGCFVGYGVSSVDFFLLRCWKNSVACCGVFVAAVVFFVG